MSEEAYKAFPTLQVRSKRLSQAKRQARDEALRAEGADIDAIEKEYGLGTQAIGIIKDWKSKKYGVTRIRDRNQALMSEVLYWIRVIDPDRKSQTISWRAKGQAIRDAILANPGKSNNYIASLLEGVNKAKVVYQRGRLRKSGLLPKADQKPRRIALSLSERKALLADLRQDPHPSESLLRTKYNVGLNTARLLVHDNWIPSDSSEKIVDVSLFLDAAQEIAGRFFSKISPVIRTEIAQLAKQPGWISQIDGFRPWPNSDEFRKLDAILTYYLQEAEVKGLKDLEFRTVAGHSITLKMPKQIFLSLHFALAGRLVILNRRNVHRLSDAGTPDPSPTREQLEGVLISMMKDGRMAAAPSQEFAPQEVAIAARRSGYLATLIASAKTSWPRILEKLKQLTSDLEKGKNRKNSTAVAQTGQTAVAAFKTGAGNDIEPSEISAGTTAKTEPAAPAETASETRFMGTVAEVTTNVGRDGKTQSPSERRISATPDAKLDALETLAVLDNSVQSSVPAGTTDETPFSKRFKTAFPKLAECIPPDVLKNKDTLWQSVSDDLKDRPRFDRELGELLKNKRIFDCTGFKVNLLLMTFVRRFGGSRTTADLLGGPKFIEQWDQMDDLKERTKIFVQKIRENAGQHSDGSYLILDAASYERVLKAKKFKFDSETLREAKQWYLLYTCPVVNGAFTPAAEAVIKKLEILPAEVNQIFEGVLTAAPPRPKRKTSSIAAPEVTSPA